MHRNANILNSTVFGPMKQKYQMIEISDAENNDCEEILLKKRHYPLFNILKLKELLIGNVRDENIIAMLSQNDIKRVKRGKILTK